MLIIRGKFFSEMTSTVIILASFFISKGNANITNNFCQTPEVFGEVKLNKNCIYQGPFLITKSNTILDCNDAILDGVDQIPNGIMVDAQGHGISNVAIKNCNIKNYIYSGIRISSGIPADKLSKMHNANYKKNASNITIDSVRISKVSRVGIYLEAYTTNTVITNSVIRNSGGVGIYLDQASKNNIIIRNKIINNGNNAHGNKREGIAVDSSAGNLIQDNFLEGNGLGGVFLYKNCGEKFSTGKSVIRWQHSDNNVIRGNYFENEPVGIWIASRQSYNLKKWDCGDKAMDDEGKYYEDFSNHNRVQNNTFCNIYIPIRIEGDYNIISNNSFDKKGSMEVQLPTSMREKLTGKKTKGNILTGGKKVYCTDNKIISMGSLQHFQ